MKPLISLLLVVGFCLGTVGAAGFHTPLDAEYLETNPDATTEPNAIAMFVAGLGAVFVGGFLARSRRKADLAERESGGSSLKARFLTQLTTIRDMVVELDDKKTDLSGEEIRDRIASLLANEYFDLTSESEELATALGFQEYARVWEGVATAERTLARTWSLATDGFADEGIEELPRARRHLEHSTAIAERYGV
jgi:hypothetical protein